MFSLPQIFKFLNVSSETVRSLSGKVLSLSLKYRHVLKVPYSCYFTALVDHLLNVQGLYNV